LRQLKFVSPIGSIYAPDINPKDRENKMRKTLLLAAAAVLAMTSLAAAAEIEVKMMNKGADGAAMVFEPALVKIEPGDTVKFVATDKGHNAETIKGMLPEGAAPFTGMNGEDVSVKFETAGVYGVKCLPHYGMGMVALVVVGAPDNLDQAKAVPQVGKAKQAFATLFEKLETSKTASK
jgi:pseudoazurin